MTDNTEARQFEIHPILAKRFSPRAYSHDYVLTPERLGPLFEAARWSPSSGNSQPWRFVVGFRGDDTFNMIVASMAEGNAIWGHKASAVVANITEIVRENGKPQAHGVYDLGQSVAHFSAQATAEGLLVHQMAGFDAEKLGAELALDERFRVITLLTVGVLGNIEDLPEHLQVREVEPRVRKPLSTFVGGSVSYD